MDITAAGVMAEKMMREHNLLGWVGRWNESLTQAGSCHHLVKTIYLSAPWVKSNTEEEVRQTILHEIAHALVGPRAGHGPVWRTKARSIGYTGKRTSNTTADLSHFPIIGTCEKCGTQTGRQRMTKNLQYGVYSHVRCGGNFKWVRVR